MNSFSLKFYDCMAIYTIAIFRLYIILSLLIFCSAINKLQIVNTTFQFKAIFKIFINLPLPPLPLSCIFDIQHVVYIFDRALCMSHLRSIFGIFVCDVFIDLGQSFVLDFQTWIMFYIFNTSLYVYKYYVELAFY